MTDKDDDLDMEAGLGHDPLEWLQDDDPAGDEQAGNDSAGAPQTEDAPPVVSSEAPNRQEEQGMLPEPGPEPEAPAVEQEQPKQSFRYENHKAFLNVPEKLSVQVVEPMHSEWKSLVYDVPLSMEIDASLTSDVDTAGLQLFYALVQQLAFKGCDVTIVAMHPYLKRQITLFGLTEFFAQYEQAA